MLTLRIVLLFLMASLLAFPWGTLGFVGVVYLFSIPVSIHYFLKLKRETPLTTAIRKKKG